MFRPTLFSWKPIASTPVVQLTALALGTTIGTSSASALCTCRPLPPGQLTRRVSRADTPDVQRSARVRDVERSNCARRAPAASCAQSAGDRNTSASGADTHTGADEHVACHADVTPGSTATVTECHGSIRQTHADLHKRHPTTGRDITRCASSEVQIPAPRLATGPNRP